MLWKEAMWGLVCQSSAAALGRLLRASGAGPLLLPVHTRRKPTSTHFERREGKPVSDVQKKGW